MKSGRPVVDIESTYENVYATCPNCGRRNIFNRRTDLQTVEPIAGRAVRCETPSCGQEMWITNDRINPSHQALLFDCRELLARKQYIQCVLAVTQAYEVFFSHFLRVQVLYRTFGTDGNRDVAKLNNLLQQLYEAVQRFTFEPMRSIFIHLVVNGVQFTTLAEAHVWIAALPESPRSIKKPPKAAIESIPSSRLRHLLFALYDVCVANLRNRVVHKDVYRPTRQQAEQALEEGEEILHPLTTELRLSGTVEWYVNARER